MSWTKQAWLIALPLKHQSWSSKSAQILTRPRTDPSFVTMTILRLILLTQMDAMGSGTDETLFTIHRNLQDLQVPYWTARTQISGSFVTNLRKRHYASSRKLARNVVLNYGKHFHPRTKIPLGLSIVKSQATNCGIFYTPERYTILWFIVLTLDREFFCSMSANKALRYMQQ